MNRRNFLKGLCIALAAGIKPMPPVNDSWLNDFTVACGRGSAMMLDNLGFSPNEIRQILATTKRYEPLPGAYTVGDYLKGII